jgi:hypothetical protein
LGFVGGRKTYIFNSIFGEVTPELVYLLKPYMIDGIVEFIRSAINAVMIPLGITFQDLLNCFLGIGDCPFDLP